MVFPKNQRKLAGIHRLPFKGNKSLSPIIHQSIKDVFKDVSFTKYSKNENAHNDLISITVDSENTIRLKIGEKADQKKLKFEWIRFENKLFKKRWFKNSKLKWGLSVIFSNDCNGEDGPIVYIAANYREDMYVVSVDEMGYRKHFKQYETNAKELGVILTKIRHENCRWQNFILEDRMGLALYDAQK